MPAEKHAFQAEIKELLHILVHSLYKDREIFLRELLSNAADALSKIQFEMLTNQNVLDPDAALRIDIQTDPDAKTIRIMDTGIGMTAEEMSANLGVIAQSGARAFMERVHQEGKSAELIGRFGVGFYSVFMVAQRVEVTSRSYLPDAQAHTWISSGEDSYEIVPAEKAERGTEILIHLRDDAEEFANGWKLRQIIKQHSDYIPFPIYVVEPKEAEKEEETPEPANQQTAIWRRAVNDISEQEYKDFYRSLTLDFEEPALTIHSQADAPIQYYALLYVPKKVERGMFSIRKEPGLKLYTRKILIQDYNTDLLPEYLQFVQGVVDSEDLSLNVSRETVQANTQVAKLKQSMTKRVLGDLKKLAENEPERYESIWQEYSAYLKHGVISEYSDRDRLLPLLRFYSSTSPETLITLDAYVQRMAEGQEHIYYISADSPSAAARSPHLDPFKARGIEVLYMTESADGFLVSALQNYQGHKLVSADSADLNLENVGTAPAEESAQEAVEQAELDALLVRVRSVLGDAVESVRVSKVLSGNSPVRLVTPEGSLDRHTQRVYQLLEKDFQVPARIMEINPRHPIVHHLAARLANGVQDDELIDANINLLYANALLADGIHPNPAELAPQIQSLIEAATRV